MAEVLFYHLTRTTAEATLPTLLERSLARGWRAVVRSGAPERLAALDSHLWTYAEASFLPHGTAASAHPAREPVYLTAGEEIPNGAEVLFLIEGARVRPEEAARLSRLVLLFRDADAQAVEAARADWRAVTAAGLTATYWAQEGGRWVEKARSGG